MPEPTEVRPYPVATFSQEEIAENAVKVLSQSDFAADRLVLVPQSLEPIAEETRAGGSAKGGALAGGLTGAIAGLWLGYVSLYGDTADVIIEPVRHLVGIALAGSGIGAAGGSLLAAITGSNVIKAGVGTNYRDQIQSYAIFLQGTPEDIVRARQVLEAQGINIESGVALG
ncbi:MAG TPA: hypothetical protein V6C57_14455 [Coleofasciculaceae cyanobacterium]